MGYGITHLQKLKWNDPPSTLALFLSDDSRQLKPLLDLGVGLKIRSGPQSLERSLKVQNSRRAGRKLKNVSKKYHNG